MCNCSNYHIIYILPEILRVYRRKENINDMFTIVMIEEFASESRIFLCGLSKRFSVLPPYSRNYDSEARKSLIDCVQVLDCSFA